MNIYTSSKPMPYVYRLDHPTTGEFYIGSRWKNVTKNVTSDIDLPMYKTSSKVVRPRFDEFEWQIIAEFQNPQEAFTFEQMMIKENWGNPNLLNRAVFINVKIQTKQDYQDPKRNKKISEHKTGKTIFVNDAGERLYLRTDDPLVTSGKFHGIAKGRTTIGSKGMMWVNNETEMLMIHENQLDELLNKGYTKGRLPMPEKQKDKLSHTRAERKIPAPNKGKSEFIKDGRVKYFPRGEVPPGWSPNVNKISNNGKHWFNNGSENFLISDKEALGRNLTKGRLGWIKIQSTDCQ